MAEGEAPEAASARPYIGRSVAFSYDRAEDRVRVILNAQYEDRREIWLTRRLALPLLMRVTSDAVDTSSWVKEGPKAAATSLFDAERRLSLVETAGRMGKVRDSKPASAGDAAAGRRPVLAEKIEIRRKDDNHAIFLHLPDGPAIVAVSRKEMLRVLTMLSEAVAKAGWTSLPSRNPDAAKGNAPKPDA